MRKATVAGMIIGAASMAAFFEVRSGAEPSRVDAAPTTAPTTRPVNKMCMVQPDDKIDPKVTYVYKGKVYGFCCTDCIDDFKKDPEKYIANAK